jgi:hypothetical protein
MLTYIQCIGADKCCIGVVLNTRNASFCSLGTKIYSWGLKRPEHEGNDKTPYLAADFCGVVFN